MHELSNVRHHLTLLACEMNGEELGILHGAPLWLRCESELGFKMVRWLSSIGFISDFAAGQGGYNEGHEFFAYRTPI